MWQKLTLTIIQEDALPRSSPSHLVLEVAPPTSNSDLDGTVTKPQITPDKQQALQMNYTLEKLTSRCQFQDTLRTERIVL